MHNFSLAPEFPDIGVGPGRKLNTPSGNAEELWGLARSLLRLYINTTSFLHLYPKPIQLSWDQQLRLIEYTTANLCPLLSMRTNMPLLSRSLALALLIGTTTAELDSHVAVLKRRDCPDYVDYSAKKQ